MKQPNFYNASHKKYLDNLKESGTTNMFGATSYLMEKFDIDQTSAKEILKYWMFSYSDDSKYILNRVVI